ncbi:MAG: hypothetical protein Q4G69_12145 [Planctomycetia bacterium]|nr:hypothetical protein [Planctomycetia bacterium]
MLDKIKNYLKNTLGIVSEVILYNNIDNIPIIIQENYLFYQLLVNGNLFILIQDRGKIPLTFSEIQKHVSLIQKMSGQNVVYAKETMPSFLCKRFIQKNIPFIIPDKQLYLPFAGIVFSTTKERYPVEIQRLSNCAQEILLLFLNGMIKPQIMQGELFSLFSCSRQTFFTALNELEYLNLLKKSNRGKFKVLQFSSFNPSFFNEAVAYIEDPVKRRIGIEKEDFNPEYMYESDTTLLSRQTMITESEQNVWAISVSDFNKIKKNLNLLSVKDAPAVLQIWSRSPLLPLCKHVDNVSLYVMLKNHSDERIQMLLDELKEKIYDQRT